MIFFLRHSLMLLHWSDAAFSKQFLLGKDISEQCNLVPSPEFDYCHWLPAAFRKAEFLNAASTKVFALFQNNVAKLKLLL